MPTTLPPLISASEISPGKYVIIDVRSGPGAAEKYNAGHLQGAFHIDLDRDLTKKSGDASLGGRHPLPDIDDFAALVGKIGITPADAVIVYDDKGGANAAARLWWMLRALGHDKVQVVNGGLDALLRQGLPMTSDIPVAVEQPPYPAKTWRMPTATIEDVQAAVKNPDALVIDVREGYRYRGEREPIDLIAGHIPGAINIPYLENLNDDGTFREKEELAARYRHAMDQRDPASIIVHCGSGVTACHTLLALEHAGVNGASLYVGSWSEWSRRDLPIGTGE